MDQVSRLPHRRRPVPAEAWAVQRAFAGLSHEHRQVVVQAYYHHATTDQIAAALAISPGTVKSRLHYALCALRHACADADRTGAT